MSAFAFVMIVAGMWTFGFLTGRLIKQAKYEDRLREVELKNARMYEQMTPAQRLNS